MKLKYPRKITIANHDFKVKYLKKEGGGRVRFYPNEITIGLNTQDESAIFEVICHEVSEAIHIILMTRYNDPSVANDYQFIMNHKAFDVHNSIFSNAITQFIK